MCARGCVCVCVCVCVCLCLRPRYFGKDCCCSIFYACSVTSAARSNYYSSQEFGITVDAALTALEEKGVALTLLAEFAEAADDPWRLKGAQPKRLGL